MAKLSTWRVGGPARVLFTPADMEDLRCFLLEACEDFLMIGYGSNLLVRDGGVDEVVIRTAPGLCTCVGKRTAWYMPKPGWLP